MPRSKPTLVEERRMTLGTWERDLEDRRVFASSVKDIGTGVGMIGLGLLPVALPLAAVLAVVFWKEDIEEQIQNVENWFNPNIGDADALIEEHLTAPTEEGEPTPYGKYQATKMAAKDNREAEFMKEHGAVEGQADPQLWVDWKLSHPLPRSLGVDNAVYQVSIRATAARRFSAQFVPIAGQVATLFGMAMPGQYYTTATDAEGFIDDPLLDLLAVRSSVMTFENFRRRTREGAKVGEGIESELNMPWAA